jgi:hypothetical protein
MNAKLRFALAVGILAATMVAAVALIGAGIWSGLRPAGPGRGGLEWGAR